MKLVIHFFVVTIMILSMSWAFAQRLDDANRQVCTEIVTPYRDRYELDENAGPGLWCSIATFSDDLAKKLLAVCPIGARCYVEGSVSVDDFVWLSIRQIKNTEARGAATVRSGGHAQGVMSEAQARKSAIKILWG